MSSITKKAGTILAPSLIVLIDEVDDAAQVHTAVAYLIWLVHIKPPGHPFYRLLDEVHTIRVKFVVFPDENI